MLHVIYITILTLSFSAWALVQGRQLGAALYRLSWENASQKSIEAFVGVWLVGVHGEN